MAEKTPSDKSFFSHLFWTAFYFLRTYLMGLWWALLQFLSPHRMLNEIPKRSGETAIVTGGAGGIGSEVVKQLLEADMTVIVACRNITVGKKMIKEFRRGGVNSGQAECIQLDLESFHSVKKFVKSFLNKKIPLHVLINNAACWRPHKMTADGFETAFQVNYLSHFLLTLLLLPALISGSKDGRFSRIVNVSSMVSTLGTVNFDDLLMRRYYNRNMAYCNTKLMQVVSSNYLNKRFRQEKLPIESFAVHPGIVRTDLFRHFQLLGLMKIGSRIICWSPKQGADPVVFTALSESLQGQGGKMLRNCIFMPPNPQANDVSIQLKLWEKSCSLTKLNLAKPQSSIVPDPFVLIDIE